MDSTFWEKLQNVKSNNEFLEIMAEHQKQERIKEIYKKYPFLENYTFENFITDQDFQKTIKDKALDFIQDYKNNWFL